ncbi:DUF262 domain-containing protein [Actinomadura sp. ATCC 31491]|uniref:DUF262 domain-containing protein n=1 Tax=Actinomadura luzonensis TaxID=2805427 RepID=A0ABT0FM83_9ACTN|nr:DUF262 domain-containing protein [Actinomadura luzonensis]MCK2213455.1 DUF262 domain-containing protein [Actinomadura luzonensis]
MDDQEDLDIRFDHLDTQWGDVEDDEEPVAPDAVSQAVVTDTDWTAETILSQLRRGNIQLNPRFQRRDAWDLKRKSRFIESLILGLPIPQLVLAEDKRRRGSFLVLDGKQRLLALRQFAEGSSFAANTTEEFRKFSLRGLDVRTDLNRQTLAKMENDAARVEDLNSFLNQTIRTVVVRAWPNEEFLNLVFLRLNTGSVSLSPQELRQALHPGEFTNFLDDHASASTSLQRALKLNGPDFRMRDVEILLRYFAFSYYLPDYRGDLKKFLDGTTEKLNQKWLAEESGIRDAALQCDRAIDCTVAIFGSDAFHRWDRDHYENRFNRAIFDVMTYYFSTPSVRAAAQARAVDVREAFQDLCDVDTEFVQAVQSTTKSINATQYRLQKWGETLAPIVGENQLRIPYIGDDEKIVFKAD